MRRIACSIVFASLMLAPALSLDAQGEPQVTFTPSHPSQRPQAERPNGHVTGTVICGDNRYPARGALVILTTLLSDDKSQQISTTQTMARVGMDGFYKVDHLAPGEYAAIVMLPGYLSAMDDVLSAGTNSLTPAAQRAALVKNGTVTIKGDQTARFDIVLERGASVSG